MTIYIVEASDPDIVTRIDNVFSIHKIDQFVYMVCKVYRLGGYVRTDALTFRDLISLESN